MPATRSSGRIPSVLRPVLAKATENLKAGVTLTVDEEDKILIPAIVEEAKKEGTTVQTTEHRRIYLERLDSQVPEPSSVVRTDLPSLSTKDGYERAAKLLEPRTWLRRSG